MYNIRSVEHYVAVRAYRKLSICPLAQKPFFTSSEFNIKLIGCLHLVFSCCWQTSTCDHLFTVIPGHSLNQLLLMKGPKWHLRSVRRDGQWIVTVTSLIVRVPRISMSMLQIRRQNVGGTSYRQPWPMNYRPVDAVVRRLIFNFPQSSL